VLRAEGECRLETGTDVADHVVELPAALVVHGDNDRASLGGDTRHRGIVAKAPDIIDSVGAGVQRRPRDRGVVGIDRDWQVGDGAHGFDDRHDAAGFLGGVQFFGAGPRGLAADVDPVGAAGFHTFRERRRRFGIGAQAVAAEGIGRGVDDAHDEGARTPAELTAADSQRREAVLIGHAR